MNELKLVERLTEWQRLKALVLESVSSPLTRRVYNMALDEFMIWFRQEPRPGFSKATVRLEGFPASPGARFVVGRSEERRVGKECRSRWSPYH